MFWDHRFPEVSVIVSIKYLPLRDQVAVIRRLRELGRQLRGEDKLKKAMKIVRK